MGWVKDDPVPEYVLSKYSNKGNKEVFFTLYAKIEITSLAELYASGDPVGDIKPFFKTPFKIKYLICYIIY